MSEKEKHKVSLSADKWVLSQGTYGPEVCAKAKGLGLRFVNKSNSPAKFVCSEKVIISLPEARSLLVSCSGSIEENAGGYVSVNGFEVPLNGRAVMPIAGSIELTIEVSINANSSLKVNGIKLTGMSEGKDLAADLDKHADILVVTPTYPSYQNLYLSAFAHARNKAYIEQGLNIQVAVVGDYWYSMTYEIEGIRVYKGPAQDLSRLIQKKQYAVIVTHFVDSRFFSIFRENVTDENLIFICHGPETTFEILQDLVRPYESEPLTELPDFSENKKDIKEFADKDNVDWVFVSDWLKNASEKLMGFSFRHSHVISNYINEDLFCYKEKDPGDRKKILTIRKFDNIRVHSLDIVAKTITELSKRPFFEDLHFCLIGDGDYYDELVEPLKGFDNIEFHRTFLPQKEIAKLHSQYGILLLPSRHDSHGVSMCEAASSGLAVVASDVTGNAYFLDDEHNHTLAPPEDPRAHADVIERLYYNPDEFLQISKRISEHVHKVCGKENTILREIALIQSRAEAHAGFKNRVKGLLHNKTKKKK